MLAEIGFVSAVEPLVDLVQTTNNTRIQAKALRALGHLGDERGKELLTVMLRSRVLAVRLNAIGALGRVGGENVVRPLQQLSIDRPVRALLSRVNSSAAI